MPGASARSADTASAEKIGAAAVSIMGNAGSSPADLIRITVGSRQSTVDRAALPHPGGRLSAASRHATLTFVKRILPAALFAVGAAVLLGATSLLPARVDSVARSVEEVRERRFARTVPASEIGEQELKKVLKAKIGESFPTSPADTMRTLVAFGLIDETPGLLEKLVDFYASQVIAFYDPEPRRFFVVRGAEKTLDSGGMPGMEGMAEKLIFAHELTHALQDESMGLDARMKALKDDGDRGLALQSLLEGDRPALEGSPEVDVRDSPRRPAFRARRRSSAGRWREAGAPGVSVPLLGHAG